MTYPKRPPYFAHKFLRSLIKQAVAQEIGPDGLCLLTCIAMTEDAKGYTGAVTFTNWQLLPLCGFTNEKKLVVVRKRCMKHGLLHYEKGNKTKVGKYWCIAAVVAKNDWPVDENHEELLPPIYTVKNDGQSAGKVQGKRRDKCRETAGQSAGEHATLQPVPEPHPKPCPKTSKSQSPSTISARPNGDGALVMQWGKTRDDADLLNDSKIDELFGSVVANGIAHDTNEDRQRFAALLFSLRRQGSAKFGLLTRILEGRVKSKFAKGTDWRNRATDADLDRARRALKALDADDAE